MAFLLGCEKLSLEFPTKLILKKVSFGINEGDCIGILGPNGAGKSSLLKLLSQDLEPDEGKVFYNGKLSIGRLGQRDALDDASSVYEAVIGDIPEYEWASDPHIRSVIATLLEGVDLQDKVGTLSGGQRRRADLARLLIRDFDILMLDEPTNHLDMASIAWLAQYLRQHFYKSAKALLVVTHDRWFLDEVTNTTWELHDGILDVYEGGFSAYILQRVERERLAAVAEQKRRNLARKELAWLSRGARARSTKPKFHLERARALVEYEPEVRNSLQLKQMASVRLGKQVLELSHLYVVRSGKRILDGIDWIIGPGDRIGILGANGAGKTTLLDTLRQHLPPTSGTLKVGKTVKFAVLTQHLDELECYAQDRVFEVLGRYKTRYVVDGKELSPGQMIERLGFSKNHLSSRVCDLSGGQKRRLQFMLILLDEPNVLILDEPGNDLDTDMLAVVEDLLDNWAGTLILVSHDRYLMERVCDDMFMLADGKIRHLPGGVDEFLKRLDQVNGASPARGDSKKLVPGVQSAKGAAGLEAAGQGSVNMAVGLSNAQVHQLKKQMNSSMRKIGTLESKIAKARLEMHELDPSDYVALGQAQEKISALEGELAALEELWMDIATQLEDTSGC